MSRTSCLTPAELTAFNQGELPEENLQQLAEHLECCPKCEAAARALDSVSDPIADAYRHSALTGPLPVAAAPARVGEYEILSEIGRGGMGVVYRARHLQLQRVVALKMLLGGAFAEREERVRFRAEAEAVARLHHPHIVQIYEIGEHDVGDGLPRPYFTLEFAGGGNLSGLMSGRPQPPRHAAALLEAVARAAHYAHLQGIVHRDLKPSNILLTEGGEPKICDFGVAKRLTGSDVKTRSGTLLGTAEYMAPEQASGETAVGPAADVYALGAILYTALTGRPPFQGTSTLNTLEQVRSLEPVPPRRLLPQVPRDLDTVCLKCLQKEPGRRYTSALALADDLRRFLEDHPIVARPVGAVERAVKWVRRRPAIAGLVAAIVVTATVGVASVFGLWRKAEARAEAEAEAKNVARQKEQEEKNARRENARLLTNIMFDHGLNLCDQSDVDHGMLHLARALEMAVENGAPELERVARLNLAAWRPYLITQRGALDHRGWAWALAFSPDSKMVLTGGKDGLVKFWDARTGTPQGEPLRHRYHVWSMAFSPDGRIIVTGSGNDELRKGEVRLWDAATRKPLTEPLPQANEVSSVSFSPDGSRFLAACDDEIRLWHMTQSQPTSLVLPHPGPAKRLDRIQPRRSAIFSPDGKLVVTGCEDGTARLWDAFSGKPQGEALSHDAPVLALAFSPDGKTLASGSYDGSVRLWDIATGRLRLPELRHLGQVKALAFSGDGQFLATAGAIEEVDPRTQKREGVAGEVRLWSPATGERLGEPLWHPMPVWSLAFRPGGRYLLTGGRERAARFYLVPEGVPLGRPLGHEGTVANVLFSPDGSLALTASAGGDITAHARLWEMPAETNRTLTTYAGQVGGTGVGLVALLADGRSVLGIAANWARVFDITDGTPISRVMDHPERLRGGSGSPDGKTLVTVGVGNLIRFWDKAAWRRLGECRPESEVWGTCFSPTDGRVMALACVNKTVQLWDATTGTPRGPALVHTSPLTGFCVGTDSRSVYTVDESGQALQWDGRTGRVDKEWKPHRSAFWVTLVRGRPTIVGGGVRNRPNQLWDLQTCEPLGAPLSNLSGGIQKAAFSPDGSSILTGSADRRVARLWDCTTGKPIGPAIPHSDSVHLVAFSADGRIMLSGSVDGHVCRLEVPDPVSGEVERIRCWVEVATGIAFGANGTVRSLDGEALQQRRERLEELGGPPHGTGSP
jgi:WD40 repeat protein